MILPLLAALVLAQAPDASPAPAAAAPASDIPAGAPADDFGLVAWCQGALTGHMEMFPTVRPELARVEAEKADRLNAKLSGEALKAAKARQAAELKQSAADDVAQMKAGREYLVLYKSALEAAEASGPADLRKRADDAGGDGYRIWSAARAANDRDRMWSWLMWELPARCETAAKRLKANAGLFAAAYKASDPPPAAPEPTPAPSAPDAAPEAAPASAPVAATAGPPPKTDPAVPYPAAPAPSDAATAPSPPPAG